MTMAFGSRIKLRPMTKVEEQIWCREDMQGVRPPALDDDLWVNHYERAPRAEKYGDWVRAILVKCIQIRGYWCGRDLNYAMSYQTGGAKRIKMRMLLEAKIMARRRGEELSRDELAAMVPREIMGHMDAGRLARHASKMVEPILRGVESLVDQPGLTLAQKKRVILSNFREFCLKCKVENKKGELVQFVWNRPQRVLARKLVLALATGKPVLGCVAKCRKWGASLLIVHWMCWMMLRKKNTRVMLVLHSKDFLAEFRRRYRQVFMSLPKFIAPKIKIDNAAPRTIENCSTLDLYSAGTKNTADSVGRSTGYQWAHFTEVPFWHAADQTFVAAQSALYLGPETGQVIESTPRGAYGKFYETYQAAKKGESDFFAFYVPWHMVDDYRLEPTIDQLRYWQFWLETGLDKYRLMLGVTAQGKAMVVPDTEGRIKRYGLDCGQYLWWCDVLRNKHNGNILTMKQEFGDDDVSCFLTDAALAFEAEEIQAVERQCIAMRDQWVDCGLAYNDNGMLALEPDMRMFRMRERPDPAVMAAGNYVAIMDTSFGGSSQADWTVLKLYRRSMDYLVLVAKVKSKLQPTPFCDLAEKVLAFYGQPLLAIEANKGDAHINEMRNRNYPRLLRRARINVIDGTKLEDAIGFWMSEASRAVCLATLDKYIRDGRLVDPDDDLFAELNTFVVNKTSGKKEAAKNCNDDHVICTAIACHLDDAYPLMSGQSATAHELQKRVQNAESRKPQRDYDSLTVQEQIAAMPVLVPVLRPMAIDNNYWATYDNRNACDND